jgi:ligand-binding sensor domain-containing protein/serine phosphatase RsbU (regulator of sigma subunit)
MPKRYSTFLRCFYQYFLLFVACCSCFNGLAQSLGNNNFDRLTVEDGLSQNSVNCIYQDSRGFMWFGTQDGLDRYDGYTIKSYKHNPNNKNSLVDNFVWTIYEDKMGNLWIGTQNGLSKFNPITQLFSNYTHQPNNKNSLLHSKVFALLQDNIGNLWIGTEGGLSILNLEKQQFTHHTFPYATTNAAVRDLYQSRKGEILVGTLGAGLQVYYPTSNSFKLHSAYLPTYKNDFIQHIFEDKKGDLWLATTQGVRKIIDNNTMKSIVHSLHQASITNNHITSIVQDETEGIWVGTLGGGLNKLTPKGYESDDFEITQYVNDFYNPHSISLDHVSSLCLDRSGILWVGTLGGGVSIYDYGKDKFHVQRVSAHLGTSVNHNMIWAIAGESDGTLWIGTGGGGLNEYNPKTKKYTYYTTNNSDISNDHVICIAQSPSNANRLWIGTDFGLNEFDKKTKKFKKYLMNSQQKHSLNDNHINTMVEKDGYLWIGTSEGGLNRLEISTGKFTAYMNDINVNSSLSDNTIESIIVDKNGAIWCGTTGGGLNKFDVKTQQFKVYKNKIEDNLSLSNNIVKCILEDQHGDLWIGTNGGLNFFQRSTERFFSYTTHHGLPHNTIQAILQDDSDNIWVSTYKGIAKLDNRTKKFITFDVLDNLQGDEFNAEAAYESTAGEMFFGGNNGFNSFFPESIDINSYKPQTVITDVVLHGQSINAPDSPFLENLRDIFQKGKFLEVPYQQNTITFEFVGLSFRHSSKNQYKCKLENFDNEWVDLGNRRTITYTNLPTGKYIFKVKSSNNDAQWNETPASIKIKILPPYYQTWWFIGVIILAVSGAVYGMYRWRIKQIEAQKANLEKIVEQRTAEVRLVNTELQLKQAEVYAQKQDLERQKTVLEKSYKIISEKTENIVNSLRYAEKIQSIILPSQQAIDEAFQDYFIIYKPKDIVSGDFYWFKHIEDKLFISVNDCTGHGVPGAFMSMIGTTLLNEIVGQKHIYDPATILEELHIGVRFVLKQENNVNDDGIDMAFCLIERKADGEPQVTFVGAKRPLFVIAKVDENPTHHIQQMEADLCNPNGYCLYEIRGDKKSIGGRQKETKRTFTNQPVPCCKGDILYLTSDGFADQQNVKNEKFGTQRLKEMLLDIATKPLKEQGEILSKALAKHQGTAPQRDDISVMGLRV